MVKKILKKVNRFKSNCAPVYIEYRKLPINENLVLLEGGQGSNLNGNMFSMLKELNTNPRWKDYTCAFVVNEDTIEKAKLGYNDKSDCLKRLHAVALNIEEKIDPKADFDEVIAHEKKYSKMWGGKVCGH